MGTGKSPKELDRLLLGGFACAQISARKGEAGTLAGKLDGKTIVVLRQASEGGQLFGSVSTRDIAGLLKADGAEVGRSQIVLNAPIKTIGQYKVPLALHPEVEVSITVTVARSADEAQRIARGACWAVDPFLGSGAARCRLARGASRVDSRDSVLPDCPRCRSSRTAHRCAPRVNRMPRVRPNASS